MYVKPIIGKVGNMFCLHKIQLKHTSSFRENKQNVVKLKEFHTCILTN